MPEKNVCSLRLLFRKFLFPKIAVFDSEENNRMSLGESGYKIVLLTSWLEDDMHFDSTVCANKTTLVGRLCQIGATHYAVTKTYRLNKRGRNRKQHMGPHTFKWVGRLR